MKRATLIKHLEEFKGSTPDMPFGPDALVFKVRGKMFALVGSRRGDSVNLKCEPELAIALRQTYTDVIPGYHMNKTHWNTVNLDGDVPDKEFMQMMNHSYALVTKSLTKKEKLALAEMP